MKKSLFLTYFFPPERGGIQNYLYNICKRLPSDKVVVWAPINSNASDFDKKQGFKIIRKSYNSSLRMFGLSSVDYFFTLRKIVKENEVKVIHCGHIHPMGMTAYLAKKILHIPYIVYTHGTEIKEIDSKSGFHKKMMKRVLDDAQNIVVTTDFMRDYIASKFGFLKSDDKTTNSETENMLSEKFIKIPPGVNTELFHPLDSLKIKQRFELENQKIILTCGRLVPRKNHELVIKAMPNVLKRVPNAKYYIIGNGPTLEKLRLLIRNLRLDDKVKIYTKITDKDLNFYYNLCDVFIMPSKEMENKKDIEGFGLVYLEANACKKPVIAGNSGGVAEAVLDGQTGILVNPENIKEITDSLIKILRDEKLANDLGNYGYERVKKDFDWNELVKKLAKILEIGN
ncbi:MAG: glycosyltransferase family 4 protein [Patescibacteria group bacterium]|jgi:phosphatidylinositol alpha-1,6-mannosyltransferase